MTQKNRTLGIGLALAAAAALIAAAVSTSWLANPHLGGITFGPRGCTSCCLPDADTGWTHYTPYSAQPPDLTCGTSNGTFVEAMRQINSDEASGAFAPMGWVTLVACALAALGLLGAAVLAIMKRTPELPIAPTTVALLAIMIGLVSGCVFVATKPGPPGFVGVAWGFWAFGGGAVAGIAAAQMLARVLRPPDPDLLDGAMNPDDFSA